MENILLYLDNKKAKILAVMGIVIGYLASTGIITPELSTALLAVLNVLAGTAAFATDRIGRANRLR